MASVTLSGIRKSFGPVEVIKGVDLAIKDREFVVFVGPSGCGKSTLLRMIAGLEDVSAGAIAIDGEIVNEQPPSQRQIAMVFQSYALYPHKTVRDNMSFGLRMAKVDKATITRKVLEAAKALDLEPLLDRRPKELSGGQRQRVAIGRAIVRNPRLFLFDEPLSNLDAALRSQMRVEIARLHQALDTTMIYVTHDQIEAMTLADKIVVLNGGRIEQIGAPLDLYHTPSNLFVAGFIGSPRMNFLQATVAARVADALEVRLRHGAVVRVCTASPKLKAGDAVTLGIRPEHLELAESSALVVGRALVVERLGSGTHVHLQSEAGEMLIATLDGLVHVGVGEAVSLRFPARCCHVFDANGDSVPLAARAEDKELLQSSDRSAGTGSGATVTSCRRSSRETET